MAKAKGKTAVKPHKGAAKKASPFALENAECVVGVIASGLEAHGDDFVPRFTLPISGVHIGEDQVDAYLGEYTHRSWFNTDAATKLKSPMPYWQHRKNGDFPISDKFDVATLSIKCGSRLLKFDSKPHESDEGKTAAARISNIAFTPVVGDGSVLLSFSLTVRPDLDLQAPALLERQKGQIKLTLGALTAASDDKPRQGELAVTTGNGRTDADDDFGDESHAAH